MRFHKILRHTDGRRSPIYRGTAMLNFNIQGRSCHAERSEASLGPSKETLRFAQHDNTVPMLGVKVHHRARG
jgi:hypothetical protein